MLSHLTIFGRLTRDPELKTIPSGKAIVNFGVAYDTGKNEVSFLDCVAWEDQAKRIAEWFGKGDAVVLLGYLKQETWESDNGKRSKHVMIVTSFRSAMKKGEGAKGDTSSQPRTQAAPEPLPDPTDDIPF